MKTVSLLRHSPTPIRSRLFRDLLLLLALTMGALIGADLLLIEDIKHDLAIARIQDAETLVQDEISALLTPVQQQLLIIRDLLRNADSTPPASPASAAQLNARLIPSLEHIPQIAGIAFADADGREYFLRRDQTGWLTRLRGAGNNPAFIAMHWQTLNEPAEIKTQRLDYDPRRRPWFRMAKAMPDQDGTLPSRFVWSPPYRFESLDEPGITVSSAWTTGNDFLVLALDVTLERVMDTIRKLPLDSGSGFLFDGDGGLYSATSPDDSSDDHRDFYSAEAAAGGPLSFNAIAAWRAAGQPDDDLVRFVSGGQAWWGGFVPLTKDTDDAWVGIAIPVSASLDMLRSRWYPLALTAIAILALGAALAGLLVRKYSHQLRELPKRTINRENPVADIQALISRGEDTHLEFKSTMRMNLHSGKAGKEIELAWLKGVAAFLNTEGGLLLIGVADDGDILGLDADGFANDDKCHLHFKNLIDSHLGAEHSRFLRLALYAVEDKTIAVVECEKADTPIFLRHKGTEAFLIRNGPSNIELPISKALNYIAARF